MLNLSSLVESSARYYPDRVAVIFNDRKLTYAQLNAAANQFANGLRELGVRQGDKVALMCPNVPYFPIAYYGILKTGAVVVPFNVLFKGREVGYHIQDSDAVALIAFEMFAGEALAGFRNVESCHNLIVITADAAAEPPVSGEGVTTMGRVMARQSPQFDTIQTMPDDTAVILYTSGTTGKPKGAELTHSNMWMNAWICREISGARTGDTLLAALPLFHSFGQSVIMNNTFLAGAGMTLIPRFEPGAVLGTMQRDQVSIFAGVPTMYWALLSYPEAGKFDLDAIRSSLRLAISGGAALPVEVLRGFEQKYDVPILEGYGLSETSPAVCFNVTDRPRKVGSIGLPLWGIDMRCVDENNQPVPQGAPGEVVIRGHAVMKGYYRRPEETDIALRGGWLHTGDVGKVDEDGYFYIVDRIKDMIIRGGFNVYPREIEEVLLMHPAVSLAAVIGVPDQALGEEIKAFVVLKPEQQVTAEELMEFCKANMAAYKYPRTIEFRDTLPMSATGKILKIDLRN